MADPVYFAELLLDASIDTVWRAITDPAIVSTYHLAPLTKLELEVGGKIVYGPIEHPMIEGVVLEMEHTHKLAHTFVFEPDSHPGTGADQPSRVTYLLDVVDGGTRLRLTHDGFGADTQTYANVAGGWPIILSALEEGLESGAARAQET